MYFKYINNFSLNLKTKETLDMRKYILAPTLLALGLTLAGCADQPNTNLETARANFIALQNNPKASQWANVELTDATNYLGKADKAYRDNLPKKDVDQMAYLLQRRVDLANATIDLRQAEEDQRVKAKVLDIAKKTTRGDVVTFGDVLFDVGKADLKPAAYDNIDKLATFLKQNPERKVLVEGFTDNTGSDALNMTLSQQRADALARALSNRGVDFNRIETRGYGKAFPIAGNATAADRAMNRRVEVTVSNDDKAVAPRR